MKIAIHKILSLILVLCLLCSFLPVVFATEQDSGLAREEYEVLKLTNQERAKEGIDPLTSLPELQRGTDIRAEELVSVTEHTRPDGTPWYTILNILQLPYYKWAGENLAAGQRSPEAAVNAWMNSQGHRENILRKAYTHMGVGYHYETEGYYKAYWVQVFFASNDCRYTSMSVGFYENEPVCVGTALEDLELIACLKCKSCGSSYLPVLPEYCSGYDPNVTGTQKVTVSVLGQTATVNIQVLNENGEEEEPTETPTETPTQPEKPDTVKIPFADVKESDYFAQPVLWAVEKNITNGTSANLFSPDKDCTRSQVVTFLWRAAGSPEPQSTANPFTDVREKDYYYKAVLWAVENQITTGTGKGKFSPDATCTRGQVATFLWRAQGEPVPTSQNNPFSDVGIKAYYYNAVLWAVENGITTGTGKGKFSPDNTCTRGQIVTFLYRAMA